MSDTESYSYEYCSSSDEDVEICGAPIIFDIKCTQPSSTPGDCIFHSNFNIDHTKRWDGRCGSISLRTGQLCRIKTVTRGTCLHHIDYKPRRPISKNSSGFNLDWSGTKYIELRKGPYGQCKGKSADGSRCDNGIYSGSDRYCYSHYKQKRKLDSQCKRSTRPTKRQKPLTTTSTSSSTTSSLSTSSKTKSPQRIDVQQEATLRSSSSLPQTSPSPTMSPPATDVTSESQTSPAVVDDIDDEIDFLNAVETRLKKVSELKKCNQKLLSENEELKAKVVNLEKQVVAAKADAKKRGDQLVDVIRAKYQQNIEMDMLKSKIAKYKQITTMISESL